MGSVLLCLSWGSSSYHSLSQSFIRQPQQHLNYGSSQPDYHLIAWKVVLLLLLLALLLQARHTELRGRSTKQMMQSIDLADCVDALAAISHLTVTPNWRQIATKLSKKKKKCQKQGMSFELLLLPAPLFSCCLGRWEGSQHPPYSFAASQMGFHLV